MGTENHEQHHRREEKPRLIFQIGDQRVNLVDAFDNHETRISTSARRSGDSEAQRLLLHLGQNNVTSKEYLQTMPGLFETMAREEGGFDADFVAVAAHEFIKTSLRMKTANFILLVGDDPETRLAYFSRVYGRIQAIKELIWDEPATADKKQALAQEAKQYLRAKANWEIPDTPDPHKT